MRYLFIYYLVLTSYYVSSQNNYTIRFCPVVADNKIMLDQSLLLEKGDTITITTLKFYVGNFVFWKNNQIVYSDDNYHLLDIEDEQSLALQFPIAKDLVVDSILFGFGVDSITNISGVMGGDLDPTKGMFWTWQSGYINAKLEGLRSKFNTQSEEFNYHLGGYLHPFESFKKVTLPLPIKDNTTISFNLEHFFDKLDSVHKRNIMSPSRESVSMMNILAQCISIKAFEHER
jgi:hypothetical protein